MTTPIDYVSMLNELKVRLKEIDNEKKQIEDVIRVIAPLAGLLHEEVQEIPGLIEEVRIAPNEFADDNAISAAHKYLKKVGKPQSTRAICDALEAGGIQTSSQKFYSTVYTTLKRRADIFEVSGGEWGLVEWR